MSNRSKSASRLGAAEEPDQPDLPGAAMANAPTFAFGVYLFVPRRQLLLRSGQVVRVGCRALDLLEAFVRRPGELLTKRELLEGAWPSTTVVEGNLKVHIAALRRALDDDAGAARYIATVNGRGYRFIAPVETREASTALTVDTGSRFLAESIQPAVAEISETRFEDVITLLAQVLRSAVIDLPSPEPDAGSTAPRRILFIELTARDEAWIQDVIAQRLRVVSATR